MELYWAILVSQSMQALDGAPGAQNAMLLARGNKSEFCYPEF